MNAAIEKRVYDETGLQVRFDETGRLIGAQFFTDEELARISEAWTRELMEWPVTDYE